MCPRGGRAASRTGVSLAGGSVAVAVEGEGMSVEAAESFEADWEPELLCVMGPPGA